MGTPARITMMTTHQVGTVHDIREKTRKAFTDYITLFLPGSWKEPLDKLRLLLQSNGDVDWEALKGQALMFLDERRLSEDRVEALARIERLADTCKDLHTILSPAEWHKTVSDIIHAANFRAHKIEIQVSQFRPPPPKEDIKSQKPKKD